jgi:soluble lytic murein transglycosylase-like protein
MKVGWNGPYILHSLTCKEWLSKSSKLLILTMLLSVLVLGFPTPSAVVFSNQAANQPVQEAGFELPAVAAAEPAVSSIDVFLKKFGVDEANRGRVASAIVNSARKYNVDPRLVASIMIVESRANPYAISNGDSVGIMQVHIPTWGQKAEEEGVNLFRIEDNVDFGVSILKEYIRRFGMWEGVKRYKGWNPDNPESAQNVDEYLAKVQRIYGAEPSVSS